MDALSRLLENVHLYETKFCCLQGKGEWSYSLECKDTIVFYLVLNGGVSITVGDNVHQSHTGDIVMISNTYSHVAHALNTVKAKMSPTELHLSENINEDSHVTLGKGEKNAELILIKSKYDNEITRPILTALPNILPEFKGVSPNESELLEMAETIMCAGENDERLGKAAMINRMASIIMIDCLSTYIEELPEATESWLQALKDPYLAKALSVMHNAPDDNWTINKLAEVAGMSRSSFAEHFKKIVGEPPLTYLIDYRLRLAARYLRLNQHSISRISELVGYSSDSTFSQAFKRVYGESPRSYRRHFEIDDAS